MKKAEEKRLVHSESNKKVKLKRQYSILAYKCLQHYMLTKELKWEQIMTASEFQSYGSYISHEETRDYIDNKTPVKDDVIMKGIAKEFGLSHIYAYRQTIIFYSSITVVKYQYKVKYGILPK